MSWNSKSLSPKGADRSDPLEAILAGEGQTPLGIGSKFGALAILLLMVLTCCSSNFAQDEPLLKKLPVGLVVESSSFVPPAQVQAIGQKLGGKILQLSNSHIRVHGSPIQVNVVVAADGDHAATIYQSFQKIKSVPFVIHKGNVVVEYVGQDLQESLAVKTSYELGLIEKPESIRYQVIAELATIDKADYMSCNPLFNHFLTLQRGANPQAQQQIRDLTKRFTFGRTLVLRNPILDGPTCQHQLTPSPTQTTATPANNSYTFQEPVVRHGVPFVTATIDITVDNSGLRAARHDGTSLAANQHWPTEDAMVLALVKKITAGKTSNKAKVQAILEWLAPGKNIKYAGETGSRWGTRKVLEQKFGQCWDFSDCFVTLARAANVPARQVAGWFYGSSGHVWAEYYEEGLGWQQVDPTGGGRLACGIYHIPYFTTDDGEMPIIYGAMPQIKILATN